jgi:hypothetical protein
MPKTHKKSKGKGGKRSKGLLDKVRSLTLGDLGEAAAGAYEGIGKLTGWNQEIKRLDYNVATSATVYNGSINSLSLIAEGSDYNQRDGHSVKAVCLEFNIGAEFNIASMVNLYNNGRAIIFCDLEQNGVQPTVAQVLEATGTDVSPFSMFQHDNTERFIILDDWLFAVSNGGPAALTHRARIMLNSHIRFSGSAGTDAAAKEGHLYLLLIGDQVVNGPLVGWASRLSYIDN